MAMRARLSRRQKGIVILAAGKGTRMESEQNKVLHEVAGKPMLSYVLSAARKLKPSKLVVVVGHGGADVKKAFAGLKGIEWVRQKAMRGTGDAVKTSRRAFQSFAGPILILYGDTPGIRIETLRRLWMVHDSSKNVVTLLTAEAEDPTGYGRIMMDGEGSVAKIIEEVDANSEEKSITEVNTGIGIYEKNFLFRSLAKLKPANAKKELYLTDLIEMARDERRSVGRLKIKDEEETWGINDRENLAHVTSLFFEVKAHNLLLSGVTMIDPAGTSIEPHVEVQKDVEIEPHVYLRGKTKIGKGSKIGQASVLSHCELGQNIQIGSDVYMNSVKIGRESIIGEGTKINSPEKMDRE